MKFLTLNEVIEIINLSKTTIYRMISKKQFPQPIKQGKFLYWREKDIEEWLKKL
jgi:prophage regulatory protein